MAREIAEEYASSLADLTVNSKPLINMLTILAEENVEHAGVIVETVEKHLEKVHADIKLPVLYLVDSIIKNVGGAYTTKFSQSIVNMFTRTFKQVDEKTRSQMFKLRETWHDVFPATKLYQLDVKVHLIDPAWPIQAQPQANIHVNPNFVKKPVAATSAAVPTLNAEEEQMRLDLAKKQQELLALQQKKIELELEQTRRQLEMAEKNTQKSLSVTLPLVPAAAVAPVLPVPVHPAVVKPAPTATVTPLAPEAAALPVKQRLGPPVPKPSTARIAPISGAMLAAARRDPRRDPRLARHQPPAPPAASQPPHPIAPNVFDIKPLERVTKRKNVITIDVAPETQERREGWTRDPRFKKKDDDERRRGDRKNERRKAEEKRAKEEERKKEEAEKIDSNNFDINSTAKTAKNTVDDYLNCLADPIKINKLPPIPKLSRHDESKDKKDAPSPVKRRKESPRDKKTKKRDAKEKDGSESTSSPEKKNKARRTKKEQAMEVDKEEQEVVAFKELKNYHKERYRRNNEKSESPEKIPEVQPPESEPTSISDVVDENKDVDLRVLHPVVTEAKAAQIGQKRLSTEALEGKNKKSKTVFDRLFGNEDVDLRQLPQLEDTPPPAKDSPKSPKEPEGSPKHAASPKQSHGSPKAVVSPQSSPKQKDWQEVKVNTPVEELPKGLSKLDLAKAKLAEATKGKDRLGRPLLFTKSPSLERERRRTISSEDTDLRPEPEGEVNKENIAVILSQAKEHYQDGKMDKNQYNTLMFQVMQLNEKLKLKEAKQRESLEMSKRKLRAQQELAHSPRLSPNEHNRFGDIDERITPALLETPPNNHDVGMQDSDMRMPPQSELPQVRLPHPPMPPMSFIGPYPPMWRGMRPRGDDFGGPRRPRAIGPPFFRTKFDKRVPRPFDPRFNHPVPPKMGWCQGESPVVPYQRSVSPPPLGNPAHIIPPTDFRVIEYIEQDPMKTIEIDGVPREIRFYGETAVIMLDWDDPREIQFLPGARRITFDNKDSVVLNFNEEYKNIEIDDQLLDIRFGAPTRELLINGRWYECFFGAPPTAIMIDGKTRLIKLDGPPPQVDIGKVKRTDLVAGKINMIIDAAHMCPIFLDSKVQKFLVNGHFYTIRFVDSLRTVLINDVPFKVEFGGLPKPIFIGPSKHFVRFSVLPRHVRPGFIEIANMEGSMAEPQVPSVINDVKENNVNHAMETDQMDEQPRPEKVLSPDGESNQGGLDMLASLMPSSMAPASPFSGYRLAAPLFSGADADAIPGLDAPDEPKPQPALPALGLNVNDLFAKLIATGIVQVPAPKAETKDEKEETKPKPKEDKTVVHPVNLLKPETLRVKQPALVARLYGGMQCSGCGARFPPEHTVRYSQHLDWHFRQNRRDRDSARRAHSRHWHYDLSDWVQYEEVEDLEEREKSWFETGGAEGEPEGAAEPADEPPSVAAGAPRDQHCALCGDKFHQFYNEDQEEWHLRKAVRHEEKNYHPLCFEDYKASLAKEAAPVDDSVVEIPTEKPEPGTDYPIEIRDEVASQSDNDDVVEVLEPETEKEQIQEALEVDDDGDEDDVIYKAEPVDEVVVDDDADTDDETQAERRARDELADIDFKKVKVKLEPIDPDDEPIITAEEEAIRAKPDSSQNQALVSSIDGNVQLETAPAPAPAPSVGIRINITKAIPTFIQSQEKMLEDISADDDEPLPPGEEPELDYKVKQTLEGVQLSRQPPVNKGSELSGLCSIM